VELKCFVGLTIEEIADTLGVKPTTVKKDWRLARAWLIRELKAGAEERDARSDET
jgi:DNA-directed RNA polymerase specialized sigma24 family protein